MPNQILSESERRAIRADLYSAQSEENTEFHDPKIAFFVRHCEGRRVLDLGCVDHSKENWKSRFWLHKAIVSVARECTGLDYYEDGVASLREKGFNVIHGDAQRFSLPDRFEVVTAGDLIEHLPNLAGFLSSVNGALEENGMFAVTTPNPWCWKYLGYHAVYGKLTPVNREHVSWFCLQTLENLAERFGFEVNSYDYFSRRTYERFFPLPSRLKHTTLAVVFRKTRTVLEFA